MAHLLFRAGVGLFALLAVQTAYSAPPTLQAVGPLPGQAESYAHGVSGDGGIIAGFSGYNAGSHAFATSGGVLLDLDGGGLNSYYSNAQAVNAQGTFAAGYIYDLAAQNDRAYRWSLQGAQPLGVMSGGSFSAASAMSADGSVVVGLADTATTGLRAFRWTQAGYQNLGVPSGAASSQASGVSADGNVIVGSCSTSSGLNRAFRWTPSGGMADLTLLPGATQAQAGGVSSSGAVVVGQQHFGSNIRACIWTVGVGPRDLGTLPGQVYSNGFAVSGDGRVYAGTGGAAAGYHALLWRPDTGLVDLNPHLASLGVNMTGWVLVAANSLSANGSTVVGEGTFNGVQRGWVVRGLPPLCGSADYNGDGDIGTDQDIEAFFRCLAGNCCPTCGTADFNGDGDVGTDQDIEAFFRVLAGGSC